MQLLTDEVQNKVEQLSDEPRSALRYGNKIASGNISASFLEITRVAMKRAPVGSLEDMHGDSGKKRETKWSGQGGQRW